MVHDIIFFLLGLVLLVAGGNYVTDGASAIARRFGLSQLLIGVTIVAFGSSLPDLVVCLGATIQRHSELALGDVVGSNIIDILLVMGVVAIVRPPAITGSTRGFDMPMLALSGLALFFCGDDILLDGAKANVIDRTDGLMLLAIFCIYMGFSLYLSPRQHLAAAPAGASAAARAPQSRSSISMPVAVIMVIASLAALVVGGNWFVDSASSIARRAGWSGGLVGLTIVSVGAAAPDLATSLIAALKHNPGIAIGNVLGACIFNVFFIMGICGIISPLNVATIQPIDFATLAASGVAICLMGLISRRITRAEGVLLVLAYGAYLTKLILDFFH